MSDLSPETNQLLELARDAGTLSAARRTQIKASLLTQIAAGGLALQVGASSVGLGKAAWLSGPIAKLVSAVAVVSVAGAGVYAGVRANAHHAQLVEAATTAAVHAPSTSVTHAAPATTSGSALDPAVREPAAVAEPAAAGVPASAAAPSPAANGKAARAAAISAPLAGTAGTPNDTLSEETRLLRDADQALRAGNAQRALSLLDEHAARYPHGALAPERNAERMVARCQLGQIDASTARSYLAAHPSSAFTARIRDACAAR
jgi:hypothetical protein